MHDDFGNVQLWLVDILTGKLNQLTHGDSSIQSAFNWDSQGEHICFIYDNSVTICHIATKTLIRLTERTEQAPSADAVVFSPNDKLIAFMRMLMGSGNFIPWKRVYIISVLLVNHYNDE